jgi:hypothetical protein
VDAIHNRCVTPICQFALTELLLAVYVHVSFNSYRSSQECLYAAL